MENFYIDMGYIQASTYRCKVVRALDQDSIKTPTNISKATGIRVNHLSKTLSELKCRHIVECLNENSRKGRLYKLTNKGRKILDNMEDVIDNA